MANIEKALSKIKDSFDIVLQAFFEQFQKEQHIKNELHLAEFQK